jgi:hypothetical protein
VRDKVMIGKEVAERQMVGLSAQMRLADFWQIPPPSRPEILFQAIQASHAWHFTHNPAYHDALSARRVGAEISPQDLPRLLRPTSQTFKSYIDILGTPFPQDQPRRFMAWLIDHHSLQTTGDLVPDERIGQLKERYPSLEALLRDIECLYTDLGIEIITSSGTSGRSTILARDHQTIERTVESFYLSFQRYFGMQLDHRAIFIMPRQTRIAMARMVGFSLRQVGIPPENTFFTIPFPAYPDQVRIRSGRAYRSGWQGWIERRALNPFMNWMNEHIVSPQAVRRAVDLLLQAEADGVKILLFASWVHLHGVALTLRSQKKVLQLPPGSLLGTGGGFKEFYPYTPDQIRHDLAQSVRTTDGQPVPVRDVYGMAEANWAAMQCRAGNYHIPPWVYVAVLDADDRFQTTPDATGILAFFDPLGGGDLIPAFYKTADQARLINGSTAYDPTLDCPCGEAGAYLAQASIQRVDLLDEAGCAAQI